VSAPILMQQISWRYWIHPMCSWRWGKSEVSCLLPAEWWRPNKRPPFLPCPLLNWCPVSAACIVWSSDCYSGFSSHWNSQMNNTTDVNFFRLWKNDSLNWCACLLTGDCPGLSLFQMKPSVTRLSETPASNWGMGLLSLQNQCCTSQKWQITKSKTAVSF
jgi:hypothetical protein